MIKQSLLALAAVLALSTQALAAEADTDRVVTVTVDGQTLRVPLPEGLCVSTGPYAAMAKTVADNDNQNVTVLSLDSCADMAAGASRSTRYAHLKFPVSARRQTIGRTEVLETIPVEPSVFARMMQGVIDDGQLAAEFSAMAGKPVSVETGFRPVGKDDIAVYVVGSAALIVDGEDRPIAMAAAVTSVRGKVLSFNFYGDGATNADVSRRLTEAKTAVAALVAANP